MNCVRVRDFCFLKENIVDLALIHYYNDVFKFTINYLRKYPYIEPFIFYIKKEEYWMVRLVINNSPNVPIESTNKVEQFIAKHQ